jgi:hypothetical protein
LLVVAVLTLIVGPILLYKVLPFAGIPAAAAAGVVAIVAVKHLGLIAVWLVPLYALLRRTRRRRRSN